MHHDYKYFVYMLNSSSRRVLYTGITNALTTRVMEHRRAEDRKSFTAQYKAFRLVYYEEYGDVRDAIAREKQIKGWTRAKKNALVASRNPQWHDLIAEWEKKFGLVFRTDGRILSAEAADATPSPTLTVKAGGIANSTRIAQNQQQPQGPSAKIGPQDDTV